MSKYLQSGLSQFNLSKIDYQKQAQPSSGVFDVNTGCHLDGDRPLNYTIVEKSWDSSEVKSELIDRLDNDEDFYGSDESTNYLLDVTNFDQVGEHSIEIEVTSSHPKTVRTVQRVRFVVKVLALVFKEFEQVNEPPKMRDFVEVISITPGVR